MNRKAIGTLVLAAAVFLSTGAASGGCGGGGDTTAPQVGQGGVENEPTGEPTASSGEHTSAEHTTASPTGEEHPTDEATASGESPCSFAPESLALVGKRVTAKGQLICSEEPNMFGGTFVLAFSHFEGGNWEWVEDSRISVTSLDIGHTLTVSTNCNEGLWLMYFEGAGTDSHGHDFSTEPYNYPAPPHRISSCP